MKLPWYVLVILAAVAAGSLAYGCRASVAKAEAEAKADRLLNDSLPVWRKVADSLKRAGDQAEREADAERAQRQAGEAARQALRRRADSTTKAADSLVKAARTTADSAAAVPGLEAAMHGQLARAAAAEDAQASAERESERLRDAILSLHLRAQAAEHQRDLLAGTLDTLRRAGRCTITHPCFAVTVGPGFGLSTKGALVFDYVQVTGGVKLDLPSFLRRQRPH